MSAFAGNQHAETATSRLRNGTAGEVARAAVEATLALAYEQRTANLLAVAAIAFAHRFSDPATEALGHDIDARLGLTASK